MEAAGIEPASRDRQHVVPQTVAPTGNSCIVENLAFLIENDPDLARLLAAWGKLSPMSRDAILLMAEKLAGEPGAKP
ncbi:MAG: hypothetical protein HJJLKODD_00799 [Phycisphaerae bacterium]|nr:hypothetical protein [Phycisphaerae bacterium]